MFAFDVMHGDHVGGTTQRNIVIVPFSDPAGVGGWHCVPHPERLIANQEYGPNALYGLAKVQ